MRHLYDLVQMVSMVYETFGFDLTLTLTERNATLLSLDCLNNETIKKYAYVTLFKIKCLQIYKI